MSRATTPATVKAAHIASRALPAAGQMQLVIAARSEKTIAIIIGGLAADPTIIRR